MASSILMALLLLVVLAVLAMLEDRAGRGHMLQEKSDTGMPIGGSEVVSAGTQAATKTADRLVRQDPDADMLAERATHEIRGKCLGSPSTD